MFKKGIFEYIINTYKIDPNEIWVIGDNPESELMAAKALHLKTIQRMHEKG